MKNYGFKDPILNLILSIFLFYLQSFFHTITEKKFKPK